MVSAVPSSSSSCLTPWFLVLSSQWRILYSLGLPELRCDFFDLTATAGPGTGESFSRLPVEPRDMILGDAGYSTAGSIESVVKQGGDVLVRINPQSLLFQPRGGGRSWNRLSHLHTVNRPGQIGQWKVVLRGTTVEGRICTVRKSEQAIQRAHRRLERRASKKQIKTKPETWEYAKYVAVFTTEESWPVELILEWHRVRWQVELLFKRLKSLARIGHLPKSDPQSSRAWLYGKLFAALLTGKLIRVGRDISPWGYLLTGRQTTQ